VLVAGPFAVHSSSKAIASSIAALLVAYAIPMLFVAVPGPDGAVAAGVLEPARDFGAWIDRNVFGAHLWSQSRTWDPEGLWSTLPAIGSLLFGVLAGRWLLGTTVTLRTSAILFGAGIAALAAGLILDSLVMPINKNLWTPAYCVFMTGWSLVAFAFFHATMDASSAALRANARRIFLPLTIFGMNALFLFALSGFIGRLMGSMKARLYAPLQALPVAPENASLLFAIVFTSAMFAVAWIMWRKGWFVKA
jgi:predicted acyltransferase